MPDVQLVVPFGKIGTSSSSSLRHTVTWHKKARMPTDVWYGTDLFNLQFQCMLNCCPEWEK